MDGEVEGLSSSESSKLILLSDDVLVSLLFTDIKSRGVGYVNFEDAGHPFGKGGASFFFFFLLFIEVVIVTFLLVALFFVEDKAFFVIERLADDAVDFFALLLVDDVIVFPMVELVVVQAYMGFTHCNPLCRILVIGNGKRNRTFKHYTLIKGYRIFFKDLSANDDFILV